MFSDNFNPKAELCSIEVADIAEFPTELGSRCLLLRELGLNAYRNTEEELFEAVTGSAQCSEYLKICLQDSRCRAFWERFRHGVTPFSERDPVRLLGYQGRYRVSEGKHRVCLAKRAGVKTLKAYVWSLPEDTESLLSPEGTPGRYHFRYLLDPGCRSAASGEAAGLWVASPPGVPPGRFDFSPALLDVRQDTDGEFVPLFAGLSYRVSVTGITRRTGLFGYRKFISVESEIIIEPTHRKTKIWLFSIPAGEALSMRPAGCTHLKTVYRFGCWRRRHFKLLSRIFFGSF